jgi:hypothetical protein
MGSLFLSNEEMGKKDDDHRPTKIPPIRHQWSTTRTPSRKTVRRVALAVLLGVVVYLFIANIPTDVPIRDHRHPFYVYPDPPADDDAPSRPKPKPMPMPKLEPIRKLEQPKADASPAKGYYTGAVKFLNLRASLTAISGTNGALPANKNILYLAASLRSAATLLPMACLMGSELRSVSNSRASLFSLSHFPMAN